MSHKEKIVHYSGKDALVITFGILAFHHLKTLNAEYSTWLVPLAAVILLFLMMSALMVAGDVIIYLALKLWSKAKAHFGDKS